ncbi:MAG: hypothetical protein ACK5MA_07555 [Parachlamydiaceae bacterium]
MTISELLLSPVRAMIASRKNRKQSAKTLEALKESREAKLESYKNLDDFWNAMGINPDVSSNYNG